MDPSELVALLARKSELEARLDGFEKWLIAFGICVALGVVGESVFGFRTWWTNRKLHAIQSDIDRAKDLELANAQRALLELQERARPRSVDSIARTAIIDMLKSTTPDGPVDIEFISGSTNEPRDLAATIANILKEAGWPVGEFDGGPAVGSVLVGLAVLTSRTSEPPEERALVLQAALIAGGFTTRLAQNPNVKAGQVKLRVGLKP
jgi:hypothetical protein